MASEGDIDRIAELCRVIGNESTDDSGFVPMRTLLSRFNAQLHSTPLLVEGMLASVAGSDSRKSWAVFIDSETFPIQDRDLLEERLGHPLPQRLRNTIAHELVHSLAFRPSEFGIRLKARTDTKRNLSEFVKAIERETEQLSPLLLWTEESMRLLLQGRTESLTLDELLDVVEQKGISRYVLVRRLQLIGRVSNANKFLFSAGLRNLAVGMGVWNSRHTYLKGWPLFWNFDNGIVPSFLWKLPGHDVLPVEVVFSGESFAPMEESRNVFVLETHAGTRAVPNAKRMKVQVAIELDGQKQGKEFLFVVRQTSSN